MKKKITSLTSSMRQIIIMVHSFSVLIPLIVYLFIIVGEDGFGPSILLTCGIKYHYSRDNKDTSSSYHDLLQCISLLLIPFQVYFTLFMRKRVPKLIRSSSKLFLFQYSFFLIFFTFYIASLATLIIYFNIKDLTPTSPDIGY